MFKRLFFHQITIKKTVKKNKAILITTIISNVIQLNDDYCNNLSSLELPDLISLMF